MFGSVVFLAEKEGGKKNIELLIKVASCYNNIFCQSTC